MIPARANLVNNKTGRIRPPRRIIRQPQPGQGDGANADWEILEQALKDIHQKNCTQLSFEQLYRASYKIVLSKKGDELYENVKRFEEAWFREHVIPEIASLVTKNMIGIALSTGSGTSVPQRRQAGELFLRGLRDSWENHRVCMNKTADVLMYLDRNYVQDSKRPPIFVATIGLFRDHILRASFTSPDEVTVLKILNVVVQDQITMEREGDVIDRGLIRANMYMLEGLYELHGEDKAASKLYVTSFEPDYLKFSRDFFDREAGRLLEEGDSGTWLRQTRARLAEEAERCGTTISELTRDKIAAVIDECLIGRHVNEFIALESSGLRWMIDNDREEDLSILYFLVSRIDSKKAPLVKVTKLRAIELGLEIEKQAVGAAASTATAPAAATGASTTAPGSDSAAAAASSTATVDKAAQQTVVAIRWVGDILALKAKFDRLWERCFNKDLLLQQAISNAFSEFIGRFTRASEFTSLYIDDSLKKGVRGRSETEVDQILASAISVIQYLQDRDMFERYYQKHLARRLLFAKSESLDVEREMISRMKQELGNQFTSKFEGMFKDLATSTELTTGYRNDIQARLEGQQQEQEQEQYQAEEKRPPRLEFTVSILTTNCWPREIQGRAAAASESQCTYPAEIGWVHDDFSRFYLQTRNGRKLTWLDSNGSADIRCTFPAIPDRTGVLAKERRYEINVTVYGMVVLLLFNDLADGQALDLEEIQRRTNIPARELARTLGVLSIPPKSRVLNKEPAGKSIQQADRFSFNKQFVSKTFKIRTATGNTVSRVEDQVERKETEDTNTKTRAYIIDAAVVRIMKQRKTLGHSQLISEVITLLGTRFKPEIVLVKKRIEDLIAREYLERVEDADVATYRYVS